MNAKDTAGQPASQASHYRSYLLRLWAASGNEGGDWRASLEDPRTGKRIGFAGLEELFVFLSEQSEGDERRGG